MAAVDFKFESELLGEHIARVLRERPLGHFALRPFDRLTDGIRGGRFTVLSAEPGTAKTTLSHQLADEAAMAGFLNVFVTLEVPTHLLLAKSIARLSGGELSVSDVSEPKNAEAINQAASRYEQTIAPNMVFLEKPLPPTKLRGVVDRIQYEHEKPVILWVDYLQILPSESEQPLAEERLAVKEAVAGLRNIANECDIPVFAISSINRANYAKPAGLGALGGSSAIEYGVDTVIYMAVEGKGEEREHNMDLPVRPLVLTTLKNRYAPRATAKLAFDCAHATFTERP